MHVSFEVEPQWLIFAAGLVFGSAVAAAIAYASLRQQLVSTETPPSKPKASRWAEYASEDTLLASACTLGPTIWAKARVSGLLLLLLLQASHAEGLRFTDMPFCRSYSPRRVRARRGDTHEHDIGVVPLHNRQNGQVPAITHQVTMDAVGSCKCQTQSCQRPQPQSCGV